MSINTRSNAFEFQRDVTRKLSDISSPNMHSPMVGMHKTNDNWIPGTSVRFLDDCVASRKG